MTTSSKARSRRRVLALLGLLVALTLVVVGLLTLNSRPTLIELKIRVSQASFEVIPPVDVAREQAGRPALATPQALREMSLLDPSLPVGALEIKDAACVAATLEDLGPVSLQGGPGSSIQLQASEPFAPDLALLEPTDLTIEAVRHGRIRMSLSQERRPAPPSRAGGALAEASAGCQERPPGTGGWSGSIPSSSKVSLHFHNVVASDARKKMVHQISESGVHPVAQNSFNISIVGDRRRSWINLALPVDEAGGTRMVVLDPEQGAVVSSRLLAQPLAKPESVVWKDRVVLFEPEPAQVHTWTLLRPDLPVRDLKFTRWVQFEAKSALLGGTVRFPGGEKEPIQLERGFFLTVWMRRGVPMTLRSLSFVDGQLEMVLWGEPRSLKIGPTSDLQFERLPSYLEWLYAHRLGSLIYGILAWAVGSGLALMKLVGLLRD